MYLNYEREDNTTTAFRTQSTTIRTLTIGNAYFAFWGAGFIVVWNRHGKGTK